MPSNEHDFSAPARARWALGLALLTLLAGCAGAPRNGASWSQRPSPEQVRAVMDRVDQPAPAEGSTTEMVAPIGPGPGV